MSPADSRARLAAMQTEVLQALTGLDAVPDGFDPMRLRAAGEALLRKRARAAARAWPVLARSLGAEFDPLFTMFAAVTPLPRRGGPLADGRGFARFLAAQDRLPDEGKLEVLWVDLYHLSTPDGLRPRSGPALQAVRTGGGRRLAYALRLPGIGAWWGSLPLFRQRPQKRPSLLSK